MPNPYAERPDHAFWSRAVADPPGGEVDPVARAPFTLTPGDRVATAGSCFAQHIARHLAASGYGHLRTEPGDPKEDGGFSARYGNIYTARQLLFLMDEAYGLHRPADDVWQRPDGRFVDALRPRIPAAGYATPEEVRAVRRAHLAAVRRVFEDCTALVFTLGLTEAWLGEDGTAYPVAPGVVAEPPEGRRLRFRNLGIKEVRQDLLAAIERLREVNPGARVILTVSPVPLVATMSAAHVLPATIYSKSVLRVAAQEAVERFRHVAYFPSYEIITGPQARGRYFAPNLRSVTEEGVTAVMGVFERHYLAGAKRKAAPPEPRRRVEAGTIDAETEATLRVVCDEEAIEASLPGR
ncbi:GSCFA domain-containing protein [Roseomonas sp. SSH11]|uniref:GSCFA domain-containing protein n=1 Tax=Pararoseomonas baculiformis TaxID=2820812 RepID=A0ABS4AA66_9PROT|nr:GSCFA domain-containing protein [Pararoseomonas baculiformis]MBP0443895.1 GSCFA domain-containing protein [Pararoseomonas baculiformis]